jgi:hypothetical protein
MYGRKKLQHQKPTFSSSGKKVSMIFLASDDSRGGPGDLTFPNFCGKNLNNIQKVYLKALSRVVKPPTVWSFTVEAGSSSSRCAAR